MPTTAVAVFYGHGAAGDPALLERVRGGIPPQVKLVEANRTQELAAALNHAAASSEHADLALIAAGCLLPRGWLERLSRAASLDEAIAGASPRVTDAGEPAVLPEAVHPRVSRLSPHCAYIRRPALELLGPLDESLENPVAVLDEFAARAIARGLAWVLADDVIAVNGGGRLEPVSEPDRDRVLALHPWMESAHAEDDALEIGPLRRSLIAARVAARGRGAPITVTIDARALGAGTGGTQTYVGGLAVALARSGRASVRAVVRDAAPAEMTGELRSAGIEVVAETRAGDHLPRTDIAHRPQQAFVPEDLRLLRRLGERVVITHHDLISYRTPSYHESADEWRRYRRLTRVALAACDRVVFPSHHARHDAISEELIESEYAVVCGEGVELPRATAPQRPRAVPPGRELLAMIGSDYEHKNRLFALELLDELHGRGWDGVLVLAGAHVPHGGSAAAEAEVLMARPALAPHVVDIGPVAESEKLWLLTHAAAVLCPSTYEGFGLIPLEAAAAGTPCLYAALTSLKEVAGGEAATLVPWDAGASAEAALPLLRAGDVRQRHLVSLRASVDLCRWDAVIAQLDEVYRDTIRSPFRSSVPRTWEELEREQLIVALDDAYHELRERTEHGRPLIDERGGMLSHDQQRGLMRIAARAWLRRGLLGPIGALGRTRRDDGAPSAR
jgi:glycosyltransferase involved in cell wall biosynthesis